MIRSCDEAKDSRSDFLGPVHWRVTLDGCVPIVYRSRREAVAAAKEARLKGHAVALTRVETTARRWRVNGVQCSAWRCWWTKRWFWAVGDVDNAFDDRGASYAEAVDAAERCARGQQ